MKLKAQKKFSQKNYKDKGQENQINRYNKKLKEYEDKNNKILNDNKDLNNKLKIKEKELNILQKNNKISNYNEINKLNHKINELNNTINILKNQDKNKDIENKIFKQNIINIKDIKNKAIEELKNKKKQIN